MSEGYSLSMDHSVIDEIEGIGVRRLAEAIEETLERIARQHFPNSPNSPVALIVHRSLSRGDPPG